MAEAEDAAIRLGRVAMAEAEDAAILLFYHYVELEPQAESEWHHALCERLDLGGRLRVAAQGLNGTLSGRRAAVLQYIEEYTRRVPSAASVDWKVSTTCAEKTFRELSVRVVAEVVSLGVPPNEAPLALTGEHLHPADFHQMLCASSSASPAACASAATGRRVVLMDTRNCYEWQIGRFEVPGVETLLPPIRQFSELPAWLDQQLEGGQLEGATVLMYCTGGVRCETASAYLRNRDLAREGGAALGGVYQLGGGIERYLEYSTLGAAERDAGTGAGVRAGAGAGGYFRGKNHVFDPRRLVAPPAAEVVGRCLECAAPADDYSREWRCRHCRLLLLLCDGCASTATERHLTCRDCAAHHPPSASATAPEAAVAASSGPDAAGAALRVLCLHGFLQSASAFRSRCSQLQRKLGGLAQLTFIDAPHALSAAHAASEVGTAEDRKSVV